MRRVAEKQGWFDLPGWRGDRAPAEQLQGLEGFATLPAPYSVLDLGCAEGCIAAHFARENGARPVHGLTALGQEVDKAAEICAGLPVTVWQCDLREWDWWLQQPQHRAKLLPQYDVVLALSIVHKMRDPELLLRQAANRARTWLAVRLPARVHRDPRSGWTPIKPAAMLRETFALVAEPATCRGEWLGIFQRRPPT